MTPAWGFVEGLWKPPSLCSWRSGRSHKPKEPLENQERKLVRSLIKDGEAVQHSAGRCFWNAEEVLKTPEEVLKTPEELLRGS